MQALAHVWAVSRDPVDAERTVVRSLVPARLLASLAGTLIAGCAFAPATDGDVGAATGELTVGAVAGMFGCSTRGVEGLSTQLVAEMRCLEGDAFTPFAPHANITLASDRVHPFLSAEGVRMLHDAAGHADIQITSAFRTLAEQYVLSRTCSVAAAPGRSNHETGRAIDVSNYGTVGRYLTAAGFSHPLPSSDPVHYEAPGADLRTTSVLAFQRLWNANHPGDLLDEDGAIGPQTTARLESAPADGFAIDHVCVACTPAAEVCNMRDDDCDGAIDEGGVCDVAIDAGTPTSDRSDAGVSTGADAGAVVPSDPDAGVIDDGDGGGDPTMTRTVHAASAGGCSTAGALDTRRSATTIFFVLGLGLALRLGRRTRRART